MSLTLEAQANSLTALSGLPTRLDDDSDWVAASSTRNYCLQDPLLDWLDVYGSERGFVRDDELPGYDPGTDFTRFIRERGREFEEYVLDYLSERFNLVRIAQSAADARARAFVDQTLRAMVDGREVISQAVLWDSASCTFGIADLLVRSDILRALFPDALTSDEAKILAPFLTNSSWHYCVVDTKYATVHLDARGHASYSDHAPYMVQVFLYNRALGSLQGFEPISAYLLGRSWQQGQARGAGCFERLARVDMGYSNARSRLVLAALAAEAVTGRRRIQQDGAMWSPLPDPGVRELRPNMCNQQDQPWHSAKRAIAEAQGELTLLWQVGAAKRDDAIAHGFDRWDQEGLSAKDLGVNGTYAPVLDRILHVNVDNDGPATQPPKIHAAEDIWRRPMPVEFYVDFETVSDVADDFSRFPDKGGQPLIFMIGCGHVENGKWQFTSFVTRQLTVAEEARIIDAWLAHMRSVQQRLAPECPGPLVFHWSPAETSCLTNAYNAARTRHPDRNWPEPRWFDFLKQVIKAEPVVVRGAMGFGLKTMARALHRLGCIETIWEDGPTDGLGAMVAAWRSAEQAALAGLDLTDMQLMLEIGRYNEVDCRTMMEVIRYLRRHY